MKQLNVFIFFGIKAPTSLNSTPVLSLILLSLLIPAEGPHIPCQFQIQIDFDFSNPNSKLSDNVFMGHMALLPAFICFLIVFYYSLLQGCIPWKSSQQISETPNICSADCWGCGFIYSFCLIPFACNSELHYLMVAAAISPHVPSHLICECQVQQSISPHQVLHHLCWDVAIKANQKPSGLLVPCCVAIPSDIRVIEVPHEC